MVLVINIILVYDGYLVIIIDRLKVFSVIYNIIYMGKDILNLMYKYIIVFIFFIRKIYLNNFMMWIFKN